MKSLRIIACLVLAAFVLSFGRVGPVSQYGQLMAGKAGSKGQIYGSCQGVKSGAEVAVQGMSLFWSISSDVGSPFWTSDIVSGLVSRQNIQLIRAPMGVDEDWGSGNYFTRTGDYQSLMNTVVQAAINNDIYVIIDYHSHKASDNVNNAKTFFSYMAQKWGGYDNVIFEVFNEPTSQSWNEIKTYAEAVITEIRKYSDNLVLVGNPNWDQHPDYAVGNPVKDSKNNTAYTFHYYAGSHSTGGEGANAVTAMNAGLSVFVSEWGTVDASGNGGFSSGNSLTWYNWMKQHKLSGANWSVSNKPESASYFNGSAWNYTKSGRWVNSNIFAELPTSYTKCGNAPASSNSNSSSSASNPSSSASQGGTNKPLLVDNFEDGNYTSLWNSPWGIYNDNKDGGQSTIDTALVTGNSSSKAIQITYRLTKANYEYSPYVGLVVSANADEVTTEDLSACTAIQYDYKGGAHDFRVESSIDVGYNYHKVAVNASNSWKTQTVYWDALAQESGWGKTASISEVQQAVRAFSWQIQGTSGTNGTLQVDNVKCLGLKEASSSSVAVSSSSAKSSSSIASSSSVASSSSAKLVITGNLTQTVVRGGSMEPVIFRNVGSYQRTTQNIRYLNVNLSGNVLTLDGSVPASATLGTFRENFTVNGTAYTLLLTVQDVSSSSVQSSSSSVPASSATVSTDWNSNTQLTVNSNGDVIIGQSEGWSPDRVVTKGMGPVEANESYTLSFDAALEQNTMNMGVTFGSYCSGTLELDATEGVQHYTCTFKALESGNVLLTLTMPGSRWEKVTISNLSLKTSNGQEAESSSSAVPSSSSKAVEFFDITFVVQNEVVLVLSVEEGKIPEAPTSIDLPANTAQYSYSFGGWMPAVVAATEPATYVANIVRTVNAYKVTFLNYDQTELWWTNVDYGETPVYEGPAPVRQSANGYRYEFSGWTPAIVPVTGIASYTADYDEIAIVSSSSEEPSSSAESSSSIASSVSADIVISGDLVQTVVKGENFKTVTFSNVESYDRGQWEIYWIEFEKSGDKLFVRQNQYQSTEYVNVGNWTEYFTVNGIDYEIKAALVEPGSSSSSVESSSSAQTFTVTFVDDDGTTVLLAAREYAEGTAAASIVKPSNPTKDATAEYTYTFSAWTPNIGAVTADATYKAKYTATKRKYTITFENGDGTRSTSTVEYGKMPTAPAAKLPGNNAQFSYSVVGWTPDIVAVTGNATYTLEYAATVNEYAITFLNYDNTELQKTDVAYGEMPEYAGATPSRSATAQYTYDFTGWTPTLAKVTGETSYTATYKNIKRKYTITFVNGDGSTTTQDVEYGTKPTAPAGKTPANTDEFTYSFSGWSPTIVSVTGAATYTAVVTNTVNQYEIVFLNYDGSKLQSSMVAYGTTPSYTGTPTRDPDDQYTYTFTGWTPAVVPVTETASYTATYTAKTRKYTITFVNGDGSTTTQDVEYGTKPTAPAGKTPANTDEFTYSFSGWSPTIVSVTGAATYTAVVTNTVNQYEIVFLNYDGSKLQSSMVAYGTTPSYTGTPTRDPDDQYTYTFTGWTPAVVPVTETASYTATFSAEAIPVESSSSAEGTSSASEDEDSSSSAEESPCIAFEFGVGAYGEHCYNSGLDDMDDGKCYTLNPERPSVFKFPATSAKDAYWWVETSCLDFVPPSSSSQETESYVASRTSGLNMSFSRNVLTVSVPKQTLVRVQVFDMLGNRVKAFQDSFAGTRDVSLQGLPQGSYMVRVMSGSSAKTSRISIR